MSHQVLGPNGLLGRTETHRSQLMTLWVTRQNQEFITSGDLQLSDVELINATVELVGEPGVGNVGNTSTLHKSTINSLNAINDVGQTSSVYGVDLPNLISQKTHINHGHVSVGLQGMTQGHQFRQDAIHLDNRIELAIPTDLGLIKSRDTLASWPPTPIMLEAVKLEQRIRVSTVFFGNGAEARRIARFVEDWADATSSRNTDGTVQWFAGDDEGQSSAVNCQVPANCIVGMKLVFNIKPRTTL
jgi:hypothetical protein